MRRFRWLVLLAVIACTGGCTAVSEWLFDGAREATGPSHTSQNHHAGDAAYRPSP